MPLVIFRHIPVNIIKKKNFNYPIVWFFASLGLQVSVGTGGEQKCHMPCYKL